MKKYELKTIEKWGVSCQYTVNADSLEDAKTKILDRQVPYNTFVAFEDRIITIIEKI